MIERCPSTRSPGRYMIKYMSKSQLDISASAPVLIDAAKHIKAQTLLDAAKHIKEHPSTAAHHAAPVPTANTRVRGTAPTVLIKIV